ncbi:hypothetical protein GGX14DRAFT_626657 [Mycena pura]|uniref:Uncharacterized protein n=1 Tax=Mycena pura TaxID=153505 RepID=A0AAD7E3D4_9AGAR|nr:hypothetical protein GGX14DRAFT_626657 [Mycena pura]
MIKRSPGARKAMNMKGPQLPDPSNVYEENTLMQLHRQTPPVDAAEDAIRRRCYIDDDGLILERTSLNGRLINCRLHNIQPSATAPTLQIKLLEPLSTGLRDMRFAQVWKVQSGEETCVARIFDPLYVKSELGAEDVFLWIAKILVAETSAYENYLKDLQGNIIPRFLGSFLTIVDTVDQDLHPGTARTPDIPDKRSVYVLLLEYIPGIDLSRQHPGPEWPICVDHKRAIVRAISIAWYQIRIREIFHYDFAQRNLVLKTDVSSTEPLCDDSSCKLRMQVPTAVEYNPEKAFPIAVIDFEGYRLSGSYDKPLIEDWQELKAVFTKLLSPSWFEDAVT